MVALLAFPMASVTAANIPASCKRSLFLVAAGVTVSVSDVAVCLSYSLTNWQ